MALIITNIDTSLKTISYPIGVGVFVYIHSYFQNQLRTEQNVGHVIICYLSDYDGIIRKETWFH